MCRRSQRQKWSGNDRGPRSENEARSTSLFLLLVFKSSDLRLSLSLCLKRRSQCTIRLVMAAKQRKVLERKDVRTRSHTRDLLNGIAKRPMTLKTKIGNVMSILLSRLSIGRDLRMKNSVMAPKKGEEKKDRDGIRRGNVDGRKKENGNMNTSGGERRNLS